jgi:hypothetical protein
LKNEIFCTKKLIASVESFLKISGFPLSQCSLVQIDNDVKRRSFSLPPGGGGSVNSI